METKLIITYLDLPKNSVILADKAYNDYGYEDRLVQEKQIHLMPIRKVNSKQKSSRFLESIRKKKRRMIETLFSGIERLMPRSIHAVTIAGLVLKTVLFVLAYAFNKYTAPTQETSLDTYPFAKASGHTRDEWLRELSFYFL